MNEHHVIHEPRPANADTRPKVAVCIPSGDMCYVDFATCLAAAIYSARVKPVLIRGQSSIVTVARDNCIENMLTVETVTREKMDWVLFLDSDMTFPPDTIPRLIAHNKDVVCATYVRRYPPHDLLGKSLSAKPGGEEIFGGLHEAAGIPLGVCLIRREIFDKLKLPYFRLFFNEETGKVVSEDYLFCEQIRKMGYHVWIDFDLTKEVGHIGRVTHRPPVEDRPNENVVGLRESIAPLQLTLPAKPSIIGVRPNGHG